MRVRKTGLSAMEAAPAACPKSAASQGPRSFATHLHCGSPLAFMVKSAAIGSRNGSGSTPATSQRVGPVPQRGQHGGTVRGPSARVAGRAGPGCCGRVAVHAAVIELSSPARRATREKQESVQCEQNGGGNRKQGQGRVVAGRGRQTDENRIGCSCTVPTRSGRRKGSRRARRKRSIRSK